MRADLNGHVGPREGIKRIHGGWGVGQMNEQGESIEYSATAFDLTISPTPSSACSW